MLVKLENTKFLDINLEYIPLDKYDCYLFSMFRSLNCNNINPFYNEYNQIFNFFNDLGYHVICYEKRIDDFDDIEKLDIISKLVESDILVIVFNY